MSAALAEANGINADLIKAGIKKNKILNKIIFFNSVDSTNKYLSENDFASGTIALAAEQTAGRGKHGAKWESRRGGLWFSFVITRKIRRPYDYVVLSSVAIAETLKKCGIKPEIKWPNDIIAAGKKLAGILLENDYYSGRLITGVGINVNNRIPVRINAVSLKQLLKKPAGVETIAIKIISRIDSYLYALKSCRREILKKWMMYQKNLEGTEISLINRGKAGKVKVIKVSGGKIKVMDIKGRVFYVSGEVFFK